MRRFRPQVDGLESRLVLSGSPTAAAFQEVLHRAPPADVQVALDAQLRLGQITPQGLLLGMYTSVERQGNDIDALFQADLGRWSDVSGMAYFRTVLNAGGSLDQISRFLIDSPEYASQHPGNAGFVSAVFQTVLHRPIDPATQALFTSWMNLGASRDTITNILISSPEHIAKEVVQAYSDVLGRAPDTGGFFYFTGVLASGQATPQNVYIDMLISPESINRLGLNGPFPDYTTPTALSVSGLTSSQFGNTFHSLGTAPALSAGFLEADGLGTAQIESQVFQSTTDPTLYAYAYEFLVSGNTPIASIAFKTGTAPLGTANLITDGQVGNLTVPFSNPVAPSQLTFQPSASNTFGTIRATFNQLFGPATSTVVFVVYAHSAPTQQFATIVGADPNAIVSVYVPR